MGRRKRKIKVLKSVSIGLELLDRAEDHMDKIDVSFSALVRTALTFYLDVDDKAKDTDE